MARADPEAAAMKKAPALKAAPGGIETNSAEACSGEPGKLSALQRNRRVIAKP
jgi:hypothetical protein